LAELLRISNVGVDDVFEIAARRVLSKFLEMTCWYAQSIGKLNGRFSYFTKSFSAQSELASDGVFHRNNSWVNRFNR
jgi:hypothetical protein